MGAMMGVPPVPPVGIGAPPEPRPPEPNGGNIGAPPEKGAIGAPPGPLPPVAGEPPLGAIMGGMGPTIGAPPGPERPPVHGNIGARPPWPVPPV
jgi:formin 2